MDTLHLTGVTAIESLQKHFPKWSDEMLFASHLGDPRNAFLLYFPLAYFCSKSTGIKVMWVAAISEWTNAILKWLLFGHRPYWWVNTTDLYEEGERPHLNQYHLTCETGPGSPSGHAMVTSSVLYILIVALVRQQHHNRLARGCVLWLVYIMFMLAVCVSRCYIATHFPHQVIVGTLTGALLGSLCDRLPLTALPLSSYLLASPFLLLTGPAAIHLVRLAGADPAWTIELAKTWCAQPEWVHLDTTPLFALTRDASMLLGLGFALALTNNSPSLQSRSSKLIAIFISLTLARASEYVRIPQPSLLIFYCLAFVKNMLVPLVIVVGVPYVLSFLWLDTKGKKTKES